jgi:calcium-dependent protein kinase
MAFLFWRKHKMSVDKAVSNDRAASNNNNTTTTTISTTIQDNIVRIQTFNHVSDKYDIIEMIGKGSMGAIYKVRIKPNKLGGSAFYPKPPPALTTTTTTTSAVAKGMTNNRWKIRFSKGKRTTSTTGDRSNSNSSVTKNSKNVEGTSSAITTPALPTRTPNNLIIPTPPPQYQDGNDDTVLNRHVYALKTIRIDTITDMVNDDMIKTFLDEMINEMNILRSLDHPNIIKAHEFFMTRPPINNNVPTTTVTTTTTTQHNKNDNNSGIDNDLLVHQHMCIVLELCTGGNLYSRAPYREIEAAYILEQILKAVRYMHDRGVVHRDLKFENILFATRNQNCENDDTKNGTNNNKPSYHIKVLDFGLSKQFRHKKTGYMYERVGTIYTMAPEVLIDDDHVPYTAQAEVWSIGVIAYMLLCPDNTKPFYHSDFHTMIDLIQEGTVNYHPPVWDKSNTAKDFVQHLLHVNPYQRYTIVQALQHPFIQNRDKTILQEIPSRQIYKNIECSIQQYTQQDTSILKKLALSIIAHDSTLSNQNSYQYHKNSSNSTDNDNDSCNQCIENTNSIDQLQKAFLQFDTEKDGVLSYDEFKAAILQTMSQEENEEEEEEEEDDPDDNDDATEHHYPQHHTTVQESKLLLPQTYTEEELKRIFTSLVR